MGHRRWTDDEVEYLKENIGFRNIPDIADKLERSEVAIETKAKKLKVGRTHTISGRVTPSELAFLLKVDRNTVARWITRHGLPAMKKITARKKEHTLISPEAFWNWASFNKEKIDFRQMEWNALPPEPKWVEVERRCPTFVEKNYQLWTTHEDRLLMQMLHDGYSYEEVAEQMNRTRFSVERRSTRIRKTGYYHTK